MADLTKMFKDLIQELGEAKKEAANFSTDGKQLREQLEKTTSSTKTAAEAQEKLNKAVRDGSKADEALTAANKNLASSTRDVAKNAEETGKRLKQVYDNIGNAFNQTLSGMRSGSLETLTRGLGPISKFIGLGQE